MNAVVLASSNFLVPNATYIVELVAFLLVLWVLARYVLPPINKMMEQRQATIRQNISDAEEAKQRAQEAEAESKRHITEAQARARAVVDEANKVAEQLRAEKRQQAEEEANRIVTQAQGQIDSQVRQAQESLRQQAGDLAIAVVEKVLGEGLDSQSHRTLINRTITEMEQEAGQSEVTT
jgi:F-type H+-transporting ATPase subunit b